jgi:methylated-DNA-[protein]-cysteine S-methyltransferase
MKYALVGSPLGTIALLARDEFLSELLIFADSMNEAKRTVTGQFPGAEEKPAFFRDAAKLLRSYMRGERIEFTIPVDLTGLKPFTQKVLNEVKKVAYGETISYGQIAAALGYKQGGARAVGQAVGRNPIPIVIPCHRVIQGNGSLGGFSMGLDVKKKLLALEDIQFGPPRKS